MYDFTPTGRLLFDLPRPAGHRFNAPEFKHVMTFRDRVAQGYYDQPGLTEAAVARMLQMLSAEHN